MTGPRPRKMYPLHETFDSLRMRLHERSMPADNGCVEWMLKPNSSGYGSTTFRRVSAESHVLAYAAYKGDVFPGDRICHTCDNPKCLNPSHLFKSDQKGNIADCLAKGRHATQVCPEKLITRGDAHWTRQHPERKLFGDLNGSRKHPERLKRGADNSKSKLTEEIVREMRRRYFVVGGYTYTRLSKQFGVTIRAAKMAVQGESWAHIK
jgi:hypothetical protein